MLILGLYVDNLIIAHSAKLTEDRTPVDAGSMYAQFTTKLASDWEVEDEGPLKDMLGVEVQRNKDGSITLHQRGYVRKVLEKYLPSLPEGKTGLDPRCVIPHSLDLVKKVESVTCDTSIDSKEAKFPDLVKPFQERIGSLMYLSTNTRPDIAFAVNQLCRVMAKPTPELVEELNLVFIYLHYHPETGLTYENEPICLSAASDASWETATPLPLGSLRSPRWAHALRGGLRSKSASRSPRRRQRSSRFRGREGVRLLPQVSSRRQRVLHHRPDPSRDRQQGGVRPLVQP